MPLILGWLLYGQRWVIHRQFRLGPELHSKYNKHMHRMLDDLYEIARDKDWDAETTRKALLAEQNDMRKSLNNRSTYKGCGN